MAGYDRYGYVLCGGKKMPNKYFGVVPIVVSPFFFRSHIKKSIYNALTPTKAIE